MWNSNRTTPSSIICNTQTSKNRKSHNISVTTPTPRTQLKCRITFTVADDRANILAWLSPPEPSIRHQDIRNRWVEGMGKWVLQTEEFRSWYSGGSGNGSDNAVLFCYDMGIQGWARRLLGNNDEPLREGSKRLSANKLWY